MSASQTAFEVVLLRGGQSDGRGGGFSRDASGRGGGFSRDGVDAGGGDAAGDDSSDDGRANGRGMSGELAIDQASRLDRARGVSAEQLRQRAAGEIAR